MVPSPIATLRALHSFSGVVLHANPCTAKPARCVYLAQDAGAAFGDRSRAEIIALLEKEYFLQVCDIAALPKASELEAIKAKSALYPSDSYICHGANSLGSGRSVFKGSHQLKGVGRTAHATYADLFPMMSGTVVLREALAEAYFEKRLRQILATPPIEVDFILVDKQQPRFDVAHQQGGEPPDLSDVRCVLGRRGSPLRSGHLEYLAAALRVHGEATVGSYLAHLLLTQAGETQGAPTPRLIMSIFSQMVRRAVQLTAESRVYGLRINYWADNCDVFSRVFDLSHAKMEFPLRLKDATKAVRPKPGISPKDYLVGRTFSSDDAYFFCLYPIRNVLSSVYLLAREMGITAARLDRQFSWQAIEAIYRESVAHCVQRILGIEETAAQDLKRWVSEFPILAAKQDAPAWGELLAAFFSGKRGTRSLRRKASRERSQTFCELLNGERANDELTKIQLAGSLTDERWAWSGQAVR